MNDQILNLLKKVKALADKGIGGEKANAQAKLNVLLKKYGLTESDLESVHRKDRVFTTSKQNVHLFAHVVWSVIKDAKVYGTKSSKNKHIVECSDVEFIEISVLFDLYKAAFLKEIRILERAFIMKNNLYYTGDNPNNILKPDPKEMAKLQSMYKGVDRVNRFKGLIDK